MSDGEKDVARTPNEKRVLLKERLQRRAARTGNAPLSFAQQRLWLLDQLDPETASYNISRAVRLKGQVNLQAFGDALNAIVSRHNSLRTSFVTIEGDPRQLVSGTRVLQVQTIDLCSLPINEREHEARGLAAEAVRRGFNVEHEALLRATLFRLDDHDHVLLLTMHHIVSDGWSMGVLFRELGILYDSFSKSQPSPLTDLPIQYTDFARWQHQWLQSEELEKQLDYWKEQLSGAPSILEFSADRPRPAIQTFAGAYYTSRLGKELSDSLSQLSRREEATLFMTLLAAFKVLLYRYTSQRDIVVGTPIANRTRTETEGLIGSFVNTLVLRTSLSGDPGFRKLLNRVKEVSLDAFAHQDFPFEKLVEELQSERSLGHMPVFQVLFALQNTPKSTLRLGGLELSDFPFDKTTSKLDLSLYVGETDDGLRLSFEYSTDLFDAGTVERMAAHFQTLLSAIVANPDQRISELPMLTDAERRQILIEWNSLKSDYPTDQLVQQIFEAQAERSPQALAMVFDGELLTYRDLNRRANQLANFLKKL